MTDHEGFTQKEVEVRAEGENSQLFEDPSQIKPSDPFFQSSISNQQARGRIGQAYGTLFSGAGNSIMGGTGMSHMPLDERITLNLEDVILHEQKLATIIEVSSLFETNPTLTESTRRRERFYSMRRLVGSHRVDRPLPPDVQTASQRCLDQAADGPVLKVRNHCCGNCPVLPPACK